MEVIRIPAKPKIQKTGKLRVAAYCRISSRHKEQVESLESQLIYYERKIKDNKSWLYRGVYYDIGSGLRKEQRKGLARLLKQVEKGKLDLIITKSVSRLGRNTVDVLEAVRLMKEKGVDMYFENENIKLSEQQTELLLSIRCAVAQEESRKICAYLEENGIKTKTGKTKWAPNVIGKMLHNEKYKGCTLIRKTYSDDLLSGKRKKNNGEVTQYYYEDTHPAIVSKELFERVQNQLDQNR